MKQKLIGFLVWLIYRTLSATWRITLVEPLSLQSRLKSRETVLFAHWHGDELAMIWKTRDYFIATMASTSKDGEIMNTALKLLGAETARGSSTRGASTGLRALIRLVKDNRRNCSFAVDGPKGPLHKVKPGVFEMSRLLSAPIYPAGITCDRAWRFPKSWNKTYLPKPFARVVMTWGEPLSPVNSEQDPRSSKLAETLENALHQQQSEAQKNLAARKPR